MLCTSREHCMKVKCSLSKWCPLWSCTAACDASPPRARGSWLRTDLSLGSLWTRGRSRSTACLGSWCHIDPQRPPLLHHLHEHQYQHSPSHRQIKGSCPALPLAPASQQPRKQDQVVQGLRGVRLGTSEERPFASLRGVVPVPMSGQPATSCANASPSGDSVSPLASVGARTYSGGFLSGGSAASSGGGVSCSGGSMFALFSFSGKALCPDGASLQQAIVDPHHLAGVF